MQVFKWILVAILLIISIFGIEATYMIWNYRYHKAEKALFNLRDVTISYSWVILDYATTLSLIFFGLNLEDIVPYCLITIALVEIILWFLYRVKLEVRSGSY